MGNSVTTVRVGDRVACVWAKHAKYNVLKENKVYRLDESIGFGSGAIVHIATFPLVQFDWDLI